MYAVSSHIIYLYHQNVQIRQGRIRVAQLSSKEASTPALDNVDPLESSLSLNDYHNLNQKKQEEDDELTLETLTAKPTKYHISGPGMATVVRSGGMPLSSGSGGVRRRSQGGNGMKNISPAMLRVHFPFAAKDQDKYAFDMNPTVNMNRNSLRQSGTFKRNSFSGKKF
jgi:hypothetical protein